MKISVIIETLEGLAPKSLQESYDNSGLQYGNTDWECTGIVCSLDFTDDILEFAKENKCNLIIAHHPILFKPIKQINPHHFSERIVINAIKNDICLYAIHTNLDNIKEGVNRFLANKMAIPYKSLKILSPMQEKIAKLYTYVPEKYAQTVLQALYAAGAGKIENYAECSFQIPGTGTFRPLEDSQPLIGTAGGAMESVQELKIEVIFPVWKQTEILTALQKAHPYEVAAYEIILTRNTNQDVGSGMIGTYDEAISEKNLLQLLHKNLGTPMLRHSPLKDRLIKKVAFCGGGGSFLLNDAIAAGADAFVTADLKYHDFFEPDGSILLIDVGHAESEYPAIEGLTNFLEEKFPTFANLHAKINSNPVSYFPE